MQKFDIFSIQNEEDFNNLAIEIFNYQYQNNLIYQQFVDLLKITPANISQYKQIPFLPIEFFKFHLIFDKNYSPKNYFQSSGTTSENLSKHYIAEEKIYIESLLKSFELFFGNPKDYVYLGLLPNYLERKNSSLIFMVNELMKKSQKPENGYFLHDFENLNRILKTLESENKKVILFGVSFALLDFADEFPQQFKNTIVIETGGMKGRKKEITKDELLKELKEKFGSAKIYSEYSMTELLSQAYSLGNNEYQCPPWMKILIRDAEDPFGIANYGQSGGVNIIDLANIHSCSFIATQDLGKSDESGIFQVLGRMDNSDIRGCSLLLL